MRLTLRTLLAYMDDVLDPRDQEDLGKQIDASEVATNLILRARDMMRRLRLGAPQVHGEGIGHDANTVAEYLDNTLAPDGVMEFERICLEEGQHSDEQLAEAASCHHILTMVLGEPAEIDPVTRRRMYDIPHINEYVAQPAAATPSPAAAPATGGVAHGAAAVDAPQNGAVAESDRGRERSVVAASGMTEIPDYLRASQRSMVGRLAPAVAALLVLLGVGFFAFREGGWLNPQEDLVAQGGQAQVDRGESGPEGPSEPVPDPDAVTNPPENGSGDAPIGTALDPETPTGVTQGAGPSADTAPEDTGSTDTESPAADPDSGVSADPPVPPTVEPPQPGDAPTGADESAIIGPSLGPDTPQDLPALDDPNLDDPTLGDPVMSDLAEDGAAESREVAIVPGPVVDPGQASEEVTETVAEGPVVLGINSRPDQVLLRYEDQYQSWRRAAARSQVFAGDRLLALPSYRPAVQLQAGMTLELSDATLVDVDQRPSANGASAPHVKLSYGRLIATNTSGGETELQIALDGVEGTALLDSGAVLAVEAKREFQPGTDPMKSPGLLVATLHAPNGGVTWRSPGVEYAAEEPSTWRITGERVGAQEAYDPVVWINSQPMTDWDRLASPDLEGVLKSDADVWQQLQEVIKGSKRKELVDLAARSSLQIGHLNPFIEALRDPSQPRHLHSTYINTLRNTMARSPDLATAVRQTLVDQRGEEKAAVLYEMLCGYAPGDLGDSPEQRKNGILRTLIDRLSSEYFDYRVLASENLEELTGRAGVFNPGGPERFRETEIARMRKRLEDGELVIDRSP